MTDAYSRSVPRRNRPRRPPRATLERLVSRPPPRAQDCLPGADWGSSTPRADGLVVPSPRSDTVDVTCWTPVGDDRNGSTATDGLRTTLLADPALPGGTDGPVAHTLVLEVDVPTRTIAVDYRSLDSAVVPDRGVSVRTDGDETVAVGEASVTDDGTFEVTLAEPQTDGALFVEYAVTRNPSGGRHTVEVIVDGIRKTEARLVVMG